MKQEESLFRWILPLMAILLGSLSDPADAAQIECASRVPRVKAVTSPDFHPTLHPFQSPPGTFDPTPLLSTTVTVTGKGPSCLVAHFSVMARPTDNYIVFQVRVDGVPMEGHLSGVPGIAAVPVVYAIEETDLNVPQMVAHGFFAQVSPGQHTVDVLFAAGSDLDPDPANPPSAGSPVLVLNYR
jgi:hypothetical protein